MGEGRGDALAQPGFGQPAAQGQAQVGQSLVEPVEYGGRLGQMAEAVCRDVGKKVGYQKDFARSVSLAMATKWASRRASIVPAATAALIAQSGSFSWRQSR